MEQKQEWWEEKYLDGADYCECHDMCEACSGGCSCWPDEHVTKENAGKLALEAFARGKAEGRKEVLESAKESLSIERPRLKGKTEFNERYC